MFDARVWLLWVLTMWITASSARNPLYTVLLLLIAAVVGAVHTPGDSRAGGQRALFSPLRFAAFVLPLSALFNALTVHIGDTVLLRLPGGVPLLGGAITLEALTFGIQNGLALSVIFAGFSVFNQATPARDLVRLTPRAFHEVGVVISIALMFVPQTIRSLEHIRQAQAVRGHRMRGLRDWPPVIVPLLINGLERSMDLAEAMVARGYGALSDRAHPLRDQVWLALGLLMLLLGWLAALFLPQWRVAGIGGMGAGAAIFALLLWQAGRSVAYTTYRTRRLTWRDGLAALGCAATLAVLILPLPLVNRETLYYSPYPRLALPLFDPGFGLGLLGLLVPALVTRVEEIPSDDRN